MTKYDSKSDVYVEPDDVIPFAQLCLNYWPYETGSKIHEYIKYELYDPETGFSHDMLAIRYLRRIVYQPSTKPAYLLCLGNAKSLRLKDQIANAGNLFFLRRNILEFEETHKHYREIPVGAARREDKSVCTEKGLASFVSRTIFEMNEGRAPTPEEEKEFSIPENRLWTWLGPIDPAIPESKTFQPNETERQEITEFANLARILRCMGTKSENSAEKTDEKCLARMLKYRYPNLSKTEIYDFVFPDDKEQAPKNKDSQGTRWGIFEEKRRKKKEPRS